MAVRKRMVAAILSRSWKAPRRPQARLLFGLADLPLRCIADLQATGMLVEGGFAAPWEATFPSNMLVLNLTC